MTFTTVNDDGEIQHNIAKEERKTDVTSKICKIQEDGGQFVSYKFEQQNVNDLVVETVPSGIVSFIYPTKSDTFVFTHCVLTRKIEHDYTSGE